MTLPAAYKANIPQPTDQISVSQNDLLNNFGAIQALIDINHVDFANAGAGKHFFVEFPGQTIAPTTTGAEVGLYCVNNSPFTSQPELAFLKQAGSTAPLASYEISSAGYSGNGWTRLTSGILLKWGQASGLPIGISAITFPAGPTIPAFITTYVAFLTPFSNTNTLANVSGLSNSTLNVNLSTAGSINYLAIGV